jgi:hypothetical protein
LANIMSDRALLEQAREHTTLILDRDPELIAAEHTGLRAFLQQARGRNEWSRIS